MKITHETNEQLTILEARGELVAEYAEALRKQAIERFEENVCDFVLDFAEVEFIDSAGLEALIWLQEQSAERLGQMRIAGVTENVQTILRLTRLDSRFETHPDVDSAVKSLR